MCRERSGRKIGAIGPPRCACRLERRLERRASSAGISIRMGLATCMRSERQQTANYANFPWGRGRYNMQCSRAGGRAGASVFDSQFLIFGGCDSSMLIYTIEIRYFRTCSTAAPGRHHAHRTGHRRALRADARGLFGPSPAYGCFIFHAGCVPSGWVGRAVRGVGSPSRRLALALRHSRAPPVPAGPHVAPMSRAELHPNQAC